MNYAGVQYIFDIANLWQILSDDTVNIFHNLLNYSIKYTAQTWHVTEVVKKTSVELWKSFLLPHQTKH